ncbi:YqcC family protein [Moritella marina ATCC 15381]|uniref:YqcC family protein n=2 Tax=Moritella marina TaxID=90736 RepID=A0A5J6WPG8_MORMI|nr:YqcC family protein [Moritella marina]QFI40059.1 YqcC family protein [Moritella marina ATCC 15381]
MPLNLFGCGVKLASRTLNRDTSMTIYLQAQQLLTAIEAELQNTALWNNVKPSADALASTAPFCIDTMPFTDWLQFIFLDKMTQLVVMQVPLPANMGIHPMAEEAFKAVTADTRELLALILSFDLLLNKKN